MPAYKHIIFDLDHTLWDFDTNCSETLTELFHKHNMSQHGLLLPAFIETYKDINREMWNSFHLGLIDKEEIRSDRFGKTFGRIGIDEKLFPETLSQEFMRACPTKSNLIPFAMDLLIYLQPKYKMHILTNGFKESQYLKLNASKINLFFSNIVHAEMCGFMKPDRKIFNYTLALIDAAPEECVMVGDDLEADVMGAKNAGIDQIFLNRYSQKHHESITHEITCLSALFSIL